MAGAPSRTRLSIRLADRRRSPIISYCSRGRPRPVEYFRSFVLDDPQRGKLAVCFPDQDFPLMRCPRLRPVVGGCRRRMKDPHRRACTGRDRGRRSRAAAIGRRCRHCRGEGEEDHHGLNLAAPLLTGACASVRNGSFHQAPEVEKIASAYGFDPGNQLFSRAPR